MQAIHSTLAPSAIGPYSQAISCQGFIFISGQIPLNPQTMTLISDDIEEQTEQVFANISAVCDAAHGSLADIVKLTIYLTDLKHFDLVNSVMEKYFTAPFPARATLQVSALPKGAAIEIDAIMTLRN